MTYGACTSEGTDVTIKIWCAEMGIAILLGLAFTVDQQKLRDASVICTNGRDVIFQVWCAESGSDLTPTLFVAPISTNGRHVIFQVWCAESGSDPSAANNVVGSELWWVLSKCPILDPHKYISQKLNIRFE